MRRFAILALALAPGLWAGPPPDPAALSARIDRHLEAAWQAAGVRPAAQADDAAFLRRVTLDLVGRIPTVAEVRAFLADPRPDKRARLIDARMGSAAHARYQALFWRKTWLPQTVALAAAPDGTDDWLAARLQARVPYDQLVRDLLIAAGPTPRTFLTANEGKPENLAAGTARAFLGINLDCAQCHNHPFARWTRDQFWQTAAFFARPLPAREGMPVRLEVKIPGTERVLGPKLLSGAPVAWPEAPDDQAGRRLLAAWVTAGDNPYFARNAVNRLWAHYFGTGLIEPLDDLSVDNPNGAPALLDDLAHALVEGGFDLNYLTRAILGSRAYQLASARATGDGALFTAAAVRGLTGEQLFDSLRIAAGLPLLRPDLDPPGLVAERAAFATRFHVERPGSAQRSILQALALMNGRLTAGLTDARTAPTLAGVADAPFLDTAGKVETLFLAALGRRPTAEEAAPLIRYVDRTAGRDPRSALADVFWALLNSAEFSTNH